MVAADEKQDSPHVHGANCRREADEVILRCLECELLFESGGIADSGDPQSERCPQCGLQNAVVAPEIGEDEFVIRHSSRFR